MADGAAVLGTGARRAGVGCGALRAALFLPLRTGRLGRRDRDRPRGPEPPLTAEERRLLDALADQAAVAIERISLAACWPKPGCWPRPSGCGPRSDLDLARSAHPARLDPRRGVEPAQLSRRYDAEQREELLATLQDEAERLNRFVGNLLDMTRLESGAID